MELLKLANDVADAVVAVDTDEPAFKTFKAGAGPYGEPQLVKLIAGRLAKQAGFESGVLVRRTPDMLVVGNWAVEVKLARPFGDNGIRAESWSTNLLHPYPGNESLLGDSLKLVEAEFAERRAVVVIGYEHTPAVVDLEPLLRSFELLAREVMRVDLGNRVEVHRHGLRHPVHQQLIVAAWEVLGRLS